MNSWDPKNARCEAKENEADKNIKTDFTLLSTKDAAAGKLSYRHLIFNTQLGRAFSEKTRATDSVFGLVNAENEVEPLYSDSAQFAGGTARKEKGEHEKSLFDLFTKTAVINDLWGFKKNPDEELPSAEEQETAFTNLVLYALGDKALAPHHTLLEVQLRRYGNDKENDQLRTSATLTRVEESLQKLEREGLVERIEGRQQGERLAESNAVRYVRAKRASGPELISRCEQGRRVLIGLF